ncbi:MAG TPA: zinc-ribbon domain-containing protein, partial [Candidatus Bathyarchaeia archaeon]|nr:zinc-ribbon domain-containing protein [Candidatus Bathyarchaeia archaeon]
MPTPTPCPRCGEPGPTKARFCPHCGTPLALSGVGGAPAASYGELQTAVAEAR